MEVYVVLVIAVAVNLAIGAHVVRRNLQLARDNERLRRLVDATEVSDVHHARCRP